MPSTNTHKMFEGCSGGDFIFSLYAVSPPKTAWLSFPRDERCRARRGEAAIQIGGKVRESGVVDHVNCAVSQGNRLGEESGGSEIGNPAGGIHNEGSLRRARRCRSHAVHPVHACDRTEQCGREFRSRNTLAG